MSTQQGTTRNNRTRVVLTVTAVIIAVLIIAFFIVANLYTDVLWFSQLGYLSVLTTQWIAGGVMFFIGFFAMAVPVWISIVVAFRSRPVYAKLNSQLDRYQQVIEPLRRFAMVGIPVVLGIFAGLSTASHWQIVLQWLNKTSFGHRDPLFGLDISFYFFELPMYHAALGLASAISLICLIAVLATCYLYGSIRFNGREVRISRAARVQIAVTAAIFLFLQAISIWFDQYTTVYTQGQGFLQTGAGYTEASATIPGRAILAGIAAFVAILFVVTAIIGRWRLPIIGTALLLVSGLVLGSIYPWIVQRFQVEPSARTLEAPFIDHSIQATRTAYGVAGVSTVPYSATTSVQPGALKQDAQTTANIRILDPAIAPQAFAQLQQFKQYYQFPKHLDVDRYTIDGKTQDTVISVRELNQAGLADSARTWYNNTVVYTHGYGVVAAYGNQRATGGQPVFLESGVPSVGSLGSFEPRIYFGEQSPTYSIVGAPKANTPIELDYPAGGSNSEQNATTTFSGNGGPVLDNGFKKLIYAIKFQSEQIFLSNAVTSQSQILYDRNPTARVQKVAPYLTLDSDTYPAIVDGRTVWIVDGYTTGTNYPYSQTEQLSTAIADTYRPLPEFAVDDINYIRNSVKATVDAYDGSVKLYAWDPNDPMLKTWEKIFPSTVLPMSDMSAQLTAHVRYPSDLFKVQRAILGSFHVTDPSSFYSSDDQWITPPDPVSTTDTLQPPYYLTMQVPGTDHPAFTLYSTYIPKASADSSRNVLTGYLAVDSDAGPNYGKLTLLTLPKQDTVPGPGQVENNFKTDTVVANQLALLQKGDTEVKLGNLLTLPVGGGLLYVQPVYVQATTGTIYPLLRKVLVSFGNQIAFEDTLNGALDKLFGGNSGAVAGDGSVPNSPTTPTTPSTPTTNAALTQALSAYQTALTDRSAAYAAGDLVAAAQADARMVTAVQAAIAATAGQ